MSVSLDLIKEFITITGSDKTTASHMLEACSGNLECAVSAYLDETSPVPSKSDNAASRDGIRSPIPQTQGVLVGGYASTDLPRLRHLQSAFSGFQDSRKNEHDGDRKIKKLEDLFRPPLDMMYQGSFESARNEGVNSNKWVMVNVHNVQEFACQALNRDVWSNKRVKELIKQHFIFWQIHSDSAEGEKFVNFYNVNTWPHVCIVDPRTGGCLTTFSTITPNTIIGSVESFLENHNLGCTRTKTSSEPDILNTTEDSQIATAIAISLREMNSEKCDIKDKEKSESSLTESASEEEKLCSNGEIGKSLRSFTKNRSNNVKTCQSVGEDEKQGIVIVPPKRKFVKVFPKKRKLSNLPIPSKTRTYHKSTKRDTNPSCSAGANSCTNHNLISLQNGNSPTSSPSNEKCMLHIRYPDGSREKITMNACDTIKDLTCYVATKDYDLTLYELVTNFPRTLLSAMPGGITLKLAGLCPQETVFVQEKLDS